MLLFSIIVNCLLTGLPSFAAPPNRKDFRPVEGGILVIPNGAHVEGSLSGGGKQPDYAIDWNSRPFQNLRDRARSLKKTDTDLWAKIRLLQSRIRNSELPNNEYDDPRQRMLNEEYLRMKTDVPLSKYVECKTGVCREHALVTHLALTEAGIFNYHVYARVRWKHPQTGKTMIADHGFTVVPYEGKNWVVDSYRDDFNGYTLEDLLRPGGVTKSSLRAPIETEGGPGAEIIKIYKFPKVWLPKNTKEVRMTFPNQACGNAMAHALTAQ